MLNTQEAKSYDDTTEIIAHGTARHKWTARVTRLRISSGLMARWMALDVGSKTIGVALSDLGRITVRPLTTLRRSTAQADVERVRRLVEPLERHVAEQRQTLADATREHGSATQEAGAIRADVRKRFGEPGVAGA